MEVFRALFRWGKSTDEEPSKEVDDGHFIPSPLDLSVQVVPGGSDDTIVHELSKIDEQARELDNTHRDS